MLIAAYSLFLLITPCLIIVTIAFLVPINYQKQTKEVSYAPIFAFLSLMFGFIFSQFFLWHTELSEFRGRSSITFFDQGLVVTAAVLWLYGLYFMTQHSQRLMRQTMLSLLSIMVLIIDARTQLLTGHWADESGGSGGDILVDVIGLTSFIMTVVFGYRLLRSLRRKFLMRRAARESQN